MRPWIYVWSCWLICVATNLTLKSNRDAANSVSIVHELESIVISSEARNLLFLSAGRQQIPRRYASRNDNIEEGVWRTSVENKAYAAVSGFWAATGAQPPGFSA